MTVSSQAGLPHLPDSVMIPHEQYGRIFFCRFVFFLSAWLQLGEILSVCESTETVTRIRKCHQRHINKVGEIWVNCPFNLRTRHIL